MSFLVRIRLRTIMFMQFGAIFVMCVSYAGLWCEPYWSVHLNFGARATYIKYCSIIPSFPYRFLLIPSSSIPPATPPIWGYKKEVRYTVSVSRDLGSPVGEQRSHHRPLGHTTPEKESPYKCSVGRGANRDQTGSLSVTPIVHYARSAECSSTKPLRLGMISRLEIVGSLFTSIWRLSSLHCYLAALRSST